MIKKIIERKNAWISKVLTFLIDLVNMDDDDFIIIEGKNDDIKEKEDNYEKVDKVENEEKKVETKIIDDVIKYEVKKCDPLIEDTVNRH